MLHIPSNDLVLFLCSPSVLNLDDLNRRGLYLSDIPLHVRQQTRRSHEYSRKGMTQSSHSMLWSKCTLDTSHEAKTTETWRDTDLSCMNSILFFYVLSFWSHHVMLPQFDSHIAFSCKTVSPKAIFHPQNLSRISWQEYVLLPTLISPCFPRSWRQVLTWLEILSYSSPM